MSARPGPVIASRDDVPSQTPPTNTAVWFAVALTNKGPSTPQRITSKTQFISTFGGSASFSTDPDAIMSYFDDGGSVAYVQRNVGPAAVKATKTVLDGAGTPAIAVTFTAVGFGQYANAITVAINTHTEDATIVAGKVRAIVVDENGVTYTSPDCSTNADIVTWAATTGVVTGVVGPGVLAVHNAAAAMTGGADDRASITDTTSAALLANFTADLGPGQVSIIGHGTIAASTAVSQHGKDNRRRAIISPPIGATEGDMESLAASYRALGSLAGYGAIFGPSVQVPSGTIDGATVTITPEAIVAAKIAEVDASGNPNLAAAGVRGISRVALGVSTTFSDASRTALNEAGVNVLRFMLGGVRVYGFRTGKLKTADELYWQFANVRLDMAIEAQALAILEGEEFAEIDGLGTEESNYGTKLAAMLLPYYQMGALFGASASDAFSVDTVDANTPTTIADGQLWATIAMRRSSFAEQVGLQIVRKTVAQTI